MPAVLADDKLQPIREQRDAWRADAAWNRERDARLEVRRRTRPEILDLFQRFSSGLIDVEEFRKEFDARTRKDWGVWGLAGMSGEGSA